MSGRAIEPLCAAILLTGCLVGGSAAPGRVLTAVPELLALPLLVLTALAETKPGAPARSRLWLAAAVLGLPAIQLVPLPPQLWSALPGRDPIAEAYGTAGLALPWLPLSLTPGATERILLVLLPAASVFLAVPHLSGDARRRLVHLAILIGVFDVLLGLAQVGGGVNSPLRLYATASRTDAVGLFANRNHHATFLALLILLAGGLFADRGRTSRIERIWLGGAMAWLLLGVAASGSRAGLALGAVACLAVVWIALSERPGAGRWRSVAAWGGLAAVPVAVGLVLYGSTALRLQADAVGGDLRWQIARTTWRAIIDVFPVGGGLGSFERLYARVERPDDLISAIINNAHDDWLELVLEGGLLALLLLLAALGYLVHASLRPPPDGAARRTIRSASLVALWLCALHETVDYPLRTMSVNVLLALMCGLRALPALAGVASAGRDLASRRIRVPRSVPARTARMPTG